MATASTATGRANAWTARRGIFIGGGVIVLAVWAAYANTFSAPFVFDDPKAILENPTIQHLGRLGDVLSAPSYVGGPAGRPLVNLSLAINYAIGGPNVTGYHLFNTLTHALAALTLFGIVRRTLLRPLLRDRFGATALPVAFVTALLWALHPLLTESVTCVVQRTESLMGLFYLLTLYGFIRSLEAKAPRRWQIFAILVCLAGMATKEVMVSAPVMVLLYDRTFVAGSFRAAWRDRWRFYLGLAVTWLLLAYLVVGANFRGGSAHAEGEINSWNYALTQCRAIVLYLRLAVWPHPLVVDYGMPVVRNVAEVLPQALLLIALATATFVALWRRPVLGFLGFWFFAILAPSSSFVPLITQTIAEHRMYLSLAAIIALVVPGAYRWLGNRGLVACLVLAVVAGATTAARNRDYRSTIALWRVTVEDDPTNPRAQTSLGCMLAIDGQPEEAEKHLAEAVRLKPDYPDARFNWGNFLFRHDRLAEALEQCEAAVKLRPNYFEAHFLLGGVLFRLGRTAEALDHMETSLRIQPNYVEAREELAKAQAAAGHTTEAMENYRAALRQRPDSFSLHLGLGNLLGQEQRWDEAVPEYSAAVQLRPDSALAQSALGGALGRTGRPDAAVGPFAAAVRLDPDSVPAHYNLGNALFALRQFPEAAEQYDLVVRLKPDFAEAHNNLGNALAHLGRLDEAQSHYEEALRLRPDFASARNNLNRLQALKAGSPAR